MRPGLLVLNIPGYMLPGVQKKSWILQVYLIKFGKEKAGCFGVALQAILKGPVFSGRKNGGQLVKKPIANESCLLFMDG